MKGIVKNNFGLKRIGEILIKLNSKRFLKSSLSTYDFVFCYLCFVTVFVMLSGLFLAASWSPAGKGPTSWLSCT